MQTFLDQPFAPVAFTKPLSDDFTSAGPKLLRFVDQFCTIKLDLWQRALLCHILETYPPGHPLAGHLRYRQVVVSMGRQNGKSELATILTLFGLFQHTDKPSVIGVASTADQANIIYKRAYHVVKNSAVLSKKVKATGTRGLVFRNTEGSYQIKASKGDSLQGIPVTLGIADELHIMKPEVWDSIVNGSAAQKQPLLIGITTAGDDDSILLKRLYEQGYEAIAGANERLGFFCWEAPEGSTIDTPGALEAANPAIQCGRMDLETIRNDVRSLPQSDQIRYRLNRFISGIEGWLPYNTWKPLLSTRLTPGDPNLVFCLDVHGNNEYASITVSKKDAEGILHTELIASIVSPSYERLKHYCIQLAEKHPNYTLVMDTHKLKALAEELNKKGYNVRKLSSGDVAQACSTVYSMIMNKRIKHDHHVLTCHQVERGRRKNVGDAWSIDRSKSASEVDALMSTVLGLYIAETQPVKTMQLF